MKPAVHKTYNQHFRGKCRHQKRPSLMFSASMTVEAALVLPLFLFFCANVLFVFEMMRFQSEMLSSLHDTGMQLCEYAYFADKGAEAAEDAGVLSGLSDLSETFAGVALSEGYVRNRVGRSLSAAHAVEGGKGGISYLQSEFDLAGGTIRLAADYRFRPFIPVIAPSPFPAQAVFYGHTWTGYCFPEEGEDADEEDETVYITATGEKYHRNRNCRYLKITPILISGASLSSVRNESGGKYYPCESCRPKRSLPWLYITRTGNRYHSSTKCPGLKRSVIAVRLGYARENGYAACSLCGG